MEDIVAAVIAKTGLSEAQARSAAETVIGFLKDKLPEPAAGLLNQYLGGAPVGAEAEGFAGAAKAVEGFYKRG